MATPTVTCTANELANGQTLKPKQLGESHRGER